MLLPPAVFSVLLLAVVSASSIRFNELNVDCPPDNEAPSCKFIEVAQWSCSVYEVWQRTSGLYIVIIETGPNPNVRLLANLTQLAVNPG